jgi:hypothetical protein
MPFIVYHNDTIVKHRSKMQSLQNVVRREVAVGRYNRNLAFDNWPAALPHPYNRAAPTFMSACPELIVKISIHGRMRGTHS